MIVWLDSDQNRRNSINENYARELMELFCARAPTAAPTPSRTCASWPAA